MTFFKKKLFHPTNFLMTPFSRSPQNFTCLQVFV